MNYNLITMKILYNEIIVQMISSIEKQYVKHEMVVPYVMIIVGENKRVGKY